MKFSCWKNDLDYCYGDTITRWPILDWQFYYQHRMFVPSHLTENLSDPKYTGECFSYLSGTLYLFRRSWCLQLRFYYRQYPPESVETLIDESDVGSRASINKIILERGTELKGTSRSIAVASSYAYGFSISAIAQDLNVTRERIRQIIAKFVRQNTKPEEKE